VLRALRREPEVVDAWIAEVGRAAGADRRLDAAITATLVSLADSMDPDVAELGARRLAGQMALCLQGALLVQHAPDAVADAFCASRLGGHMGGTFGQLPRGLAYAELVERATPVL
jgi:putative acyl-CoA dehydrogenase